MTEQEETNIDLAFGKAVGKGALIGLPVTVVLITLAVFLMTDQALTDAIATSLLPGTLMGVFGGGFIGTVSAMKH